MKKYYKIILIILIAASMAFPQQNPEWLAQVQKLKNRIEFLERTAMRYQAQKALEVLKKARKDLERAYTEFKHLNYPQAWILFKKAQKKVEMVEKLLYYKPAARAYFEAEKLLQRAERLVENSHNRTARYMLNKGKRFLLEAVRAYNNAQLIKAQEFQRIAIYFANKAIDLSQGQGTLPISKERIDRQLRELRTLYNEVSSAAGDDAQVKQLLQKAQSFLKQSYQYYEKEQYQNAIVQLQIGERLLYRALDLSQQTGAGQKERMKNNINSLQQYIQSIEQSLEDQPAANRIIRKAWQFYRSAQRDYNNGNLKAASAKINLAQKMATKALNYAADASLPPGGDFETRLREVRRLLFLHVDQQEEEKAYTSFFKTEVEKILQKAAKDEQAGKKRLALWELNLAVRMINRMVTHHPEKNYNPQKIDQLWQKFHRYQNIWQRTQQKQLAGMNELQVIRRLLTQTEKQLNNKEYQVAETLLDLIYQQLNFFAKRTHSR